ncbi:MAG: phosphate ABC transporter substrate-binding protein PstS [Gammaproteobacteria bacterium]|nr:phosphate ABC transporter substrate-binding protein PstS [Gammaproteobacteria bacterium]MDE2250009.1 phosphate ABC transporter substrate-binding protein PstS [Gammaproteobacteria bacterium]
MRSIRFPALAAALALGSAAGAASALDISGAGATFPYPVYAKWAEAYRAKTGDGLNYQSIGSGGGIKQIKAATVTFGASDMPLEPKDLNGAGLLQWPMVIGGVVPVVNVPGIKAGALELDGPTLAGIYMGEITKWNDARIRALNPQVALPDLAIAPVYRSDGSGTNFLFTNYLSTVSPAFKGKIGANTSVEWPSGIGAKGNEGVANMTAQTSGAIGYVEYAYAKQNSMAYVRLKNKAGKFVAPEAAAFQAAAANADWAKAEGFHLILTDQPGAASWPITGASFIIMYRAPKDANAAAAALRFFAWAYRDGVELARQLDYVPLPENVVKLVEKTWTASIKSGGKPVWQGK